MFTKLSFFILALSFVFLFFLAFFFKSFILSVNYFPFYFDCINNIFISMNFNLVSFIYIFMVCLVTFLVLSYSASYLEHYNNKKFMFLTLSFFLSMLILVSSGSLLNLCLGWDGLGISSSCLILFYPNKTSLFNSVMTMFYNRLGDVFLIFIMALFMFNFSMMFMLSFEMSLLVVFLVSVCSFSKSAQFPLSSWLPAAMSAPTPISAMVHSSTLVTAGIFMVLNFMYYFFLSNSLTFFCFVSLFTFLMGGILSSIESDFKKVIAFSTMSQISMLMFFIFNSFLYICMLHMIYHAFFKTLIFVSAGMMFTSFYSTQIKAYFYGNGLNLLSYLMVTVSVYGMSGLFFSSSFYSKDVILELFISNFNNFFFLWFLLGSLFTLYYCCKIFLCTLFMPSHYRYLVSKKSYSFPILFYFFLVLFSGFLLPFILFSDLTPLISLMDVSLISFFFFIPFFVSNLKFLYSLYYTSLDVFFTKFFIYSLFSKSLYNSFFSSTFYNDHVFFKMHYLYQSSRFNLFSKVNIFWVLLFLLVLIF